MSIFLGLILLAIAGCYKTERHPNVLVVSFNGEYERFNFENVFCFNRTYKASPIESLYESSILSGKYSTADNNLIEYTASLFTENDYNVKFIGDWGNSKKSAELVFDKIPLDEVNPYHSFAFFVTYTQDDSTSISMQKYEVKKLLSKLKALKILDNTLIYFSYNNQLKTGMREKDIKICSELIYPELIDHERSTNLIVSSVDFLPTIADLCNLKGIDYSVFDGISLESCIIDDEIPQRQAVVVLDSLHKTIITRNWKYIAVDEHIELKDSSLHIEELYNLDTDPSEQNNLAQQVRFISKKIELKNMLRETKK